MSHACVPFDSDCKSCLTAEIERLRGENLELNERGYQETLKVVKLEALIREARDRMGGADLHDLWLRITEALGEET